MDAASFLRTVGSLGAVLGLLLLALWATRRYNIRLPGAYQTQGTRRLAVVERVALDARRSVALIRRDGREHLILVSPEGHHVVESGIEPPPPAVAASDFVTLLAAATEDKVTPAQDVARILRTLATRLAPLRAALLRRAHALAARIASPAPPAPVNKRPARAAKPATKARRATKPATRTARARG